MKRTEIRQEAGDRSAAMEVATQIGDTADFTTGWPVIPRQQVDVATLDSLDSASEAAFRELYNRERIQYFVVHSAEPAPKNPGVPTEQ